MSATGELHITKKGEGQDSLWHPVRPEDKARIQVFDIHEPVPHSAVEPYHLEEVVVTPLASSNTVFGGKTEFELYEKGALLGRMRFEATFSAITGTGDPHFHDFALYGLIDRVEFQHKNHVFHSISGEMLYYKMMIEKDEDFRSQEALTQAGYKTKAERIILAQGSQTLSCDLQVPWDKLRKRLPITDLDTRIRVLVHYKTLENSVQCTTATACTISNAQLICEFTHRDDATKKSFGQLVNSDKPLEGWQIKTITVVPHKGVFVENGRTQALKVELANFSNTIIALWIVIRPATALQTNATRDPWNCHLSTVDYIDIYENSDKIHHKIDIGSSCKNKNFNNTIKRMYPDHGPLTFIAIPFCEPELVHLSDDHSFGGMHFSQYGKIHLEFNFASPVSGNQFVDIYALQHDQLHISQKEVTKLLAGQSA